MSWRTRLAEWALTGLFILIGLWLALFGPLAGHVPFTFTEFLGDTFTQEVPEGVHP